MLTMYTDSAVTLVSSRALSGRTSDETRYAQQFLRRASECLLQSSRDKVHLAESDGAELRIDTGVVKAYVCEQQPY